MSKKWITCRTHGKKQRSYAICTHVLHEKKPIAYVREPDPSGIGVQRTIGSIACAIPGEQHGSDEVVLICEKCAQAMGLNKLTPITAEGGSIRGGDGLPERRVLLPSAGIAEALRTESENK